MILRKWVDSEARVEGVRARLEILSVALHHLATGDMLGHFAASAEMVDKIMAEYETLLNGLETMFEDLRQELKDKEPESLQV